MERCQRLKCDAQLYGFLVTLPLYVKLKLKLVQNYFIAQKNITITRLIDPFKVCK